MVKKLEYVLFTFENIYCIENPITISYGDKASRDINIKPGNAVQFFSKNMEKPKYSIINWNHKLIPILFTTKIENKNLFFENKRKGISVEGDILMSAFYFLSSWQEYISNKKDKLGRFPFNNSFLSDLGLVDVPLVNYYFDILASAIMRHSGSKLVIHERHGNGLKIGITHDIDHCHTGSLQDSYRQFLAGERLAAIKKGINRITQKDIWYNFDQLLDIEKKYGVTSSYYFISENKPRDGLANADYNLQSKDFQSLMKKIGSNGHEIGIHGSIGTGFNQKQLDDEISKFQNPIIGGRFHYLLMRVNESFSIIDKSKINYDSSLGFAEHIGFRNGFCFPYRPYNFKKDRPYSFYEFPFQMMDRTFIQSNYMGLNPHDAKEAINRIMNEILKFNGYFIFIWHNNTITGFKYKEWESVLINTIEYGMELGSDFQPLSSFYKNIIK